MTCPLSVIITLRFGFPMVESISKWPSFASFSIRFIGAEFGLTIATIRPEFTLLSNPIFTIRLSPLFLSI
jgi:hypothetical protein